MIEESDLEHHVGDVNKIGHEVSDVDPGRTLTLMLCGPGMSGWGYIDPDTGEFTRAVLPARFNDQLRALNPHHQP